MTVNTVYQANEAQRMAELAREKQLAGLGENPGYIPATDAPAPTEMITGPAVDLSGVMASLSGSQMQALSGAPDEKLADQQGNYIENRQLETRLDAKADRLFADLSDLWASLTDADGSSFGTIGSLIGEIISPSTGQTQETDQVQETDAGQAIADEFTSDGTPPPDNAGTDAEYKLNENSDHSCDVTDPDGTTHHFGSVEEGLNYVAEQSKKYGGYVIVDVELYGSMGIPIEEAFVYRDGQCVYATGGGNCISAEEQARQWVQNQHHANCDTSFIYDFSDLNKIDGNSSDGDLLNALGDEMDKTFEGYDQGAFYYYNDQGQMVPDNERIAAFYNRVKFLCGLLIAMQMLMEAKHEGYDLVQQEMIDLEPAKGLDTKKIVAKYVQNRMARVSVSPN